MSGEDEPRLDRRADEPPDEWAARLCDRLHARWQIGERDDVTAFTAAVPELHRQPDVLLDLITLHRLLRAEAGEHPTAADYAAAFPALAAAIADQFAVEDEVVSLTPAPPDPPPLPPQFRFVRWLGSGGYGRVCECIDTRHAGRRVAVKLLHATPRGPADGERFRREAELAATLNHPHLCTLHQFDFDHRPPFLVLELVDGPNLRELLAGGKPPPIHEAVRIARDVAAALHHCHTQGVVHRDLKPENVQRRTDGVVKVLDLGLARLLAPEPTDWTSDERTVAGTVPYFSPEHFAGSPGPPADQFSLGVVLYELLTGRRPFAGTTRQELHTAITTAAPVSPRTLRPEVSDRLAGVVLKMLAKTPDGRFASLDEVRAELDRVLTTPGEPRRRGWLIAGIAAAVVGGGVVGWWQWNTPKPTPDSPTNITARPDEAATVLKRIATDLAALPTPDQEHQRYFRLGHLPPVERPPTREALAAVLNAVSGRSNIPLADVGDDGTLLRLDLRAVNWQTDAEWPRVVGRYPLSLRYAGPDLPPHGGTVKTLLHSDLTPFVLADWFAAAVSADPLLGELLPDERAAAVRADDDLLLFRDGYARTAVSLERAAAELGATTPDAVRTVLAADRGLTARLGLGAWLEGGTVPRSVWGRTDLEACPAAELATELKLGVRRLVR